MKEIAIVLNMCVIVKLQTEASVSIPNQKPESPTEIEYIKGKSRLYH